MKLKRFNIAKLEKIALCAALVAMGGVLIAFPQRYLSVCFNGLCLWAECVLPSLFPFMIITLLLINLGAPQALSKRFTRATRKLKLPAAAPPLFLMSVCSGYPAGSKILSEYYGRGLVSASDAKKLAPLLSTCGPLFALGTVGGKAFGGGGAGVKLLCACLISVLLTSLGYALICKGGDAPRPASLKTSGDNILYSCFYGGVTACLVAGGFICFFYTLSQIIADFNVFKPLEYLLSLPFGGLARGVCLGICEATGGCFALAAEGGFFALPLAGFLITFGGASILCQQLGYLQKCGVNAGFFIAFKFIQGVLCFGLLCLFSLF